jgi:threonine aldolase
MRKIDFAADHHAPVHPKVLEAVIKANSGIEQSYGEDSYTEKATEVFLETFGAKTAVYFMAGGGTAANVLALQSMLPRPFYSVICSDVAHVYNDEAGAPEFITGSQLIPIKSKHGKITAKQVQTAFSYKGDYHRSEPKVVSITQATERGTVYSTNEIENIVKVAHKNDALVHMDGARLFNGAESLGKKLKELTTDLRIDVLSLGMGKNGGFGVGEAVVFLNPNLTQNFKNIRKQAMQLASKTRFLAAQWIPMLENNLWAENAKKANKRAVQLADGIIASTNYEITEDVQTNGVWVVMPNDHIEKLQKEYNFYRWENGIENEVRLMTSYTTTEEEVNKLIKSIIALQ